MKIANSTVKGMERNSRETSEVPPLPLIPDDDELDEERGCKTGSFKLLSDPTDVNSAKYSFTMAYADGTQSIRFHIQWMKNVRIVLTGMNIATGTAQAMMVKQLCSGSIRTEFHESVEAQRQMAVKARANALAAAVVRNVGESDADLQNRRNGVYNNNLAVAADPATTAMIEIALHAIITMVCPYKALEKQKRFMRRKMRKPVEMKTRQYVNHLSRINFDEIPFLPPQAPGQELGNDEMLDIICYGLPKSWIREMDKQDFDPFRRSIITELVNFCERLESTEGSEFKETPSKKDKSSNKKTKYAGKTNGKKDGKWCSFHETNTHDTSECEALKKVKSEGGSKTGGFKKSSNKTWTRKSADAKTVTKKELNALVKKVSQKVATKVKKDLTTAAKRKSEDKSDSDDNSINMLEGEMKDIDDQLKDFNFDDAANSVEI